MYDQLNYAVEWGATFVFSKRNEARRLLITLEINQVSKVFGMNVYLFLLHGNGAIDLDGIMYGVS